MVEEIIRVIRVIRTIRVLRVLIRVLRVIQVIKIIRVIRAIIGGAVIPKGDILKADRQQRSFGITRKRNRNAKK